MAKARNLCAPLAHQQEDEFLEQLVQGHSFKLERIVSRGQVTPEGQWYDQERHEWVVLLSGAARLQIAGEKHELALEPGDCVDLPAHCRHRVAWTDPAQETVWLVLHYAEDDSQ